MRPTRSSVRSQASLESREERSEKQPERRETRIAISSKILVALRAAAALVRAEDALRSTAARAAQLLRPSRRSSLPRDAGVGEEEQVDVASIWPRQRLVGPQFGAPAQVRKPRGLRPEAQ